MRRVLVIAYLYPPFANSGTRRSLSFVNHLPDMGWEPTVLTLADPPAKVCDAALLSEVRTGTHIERVPLGSDSLARAMAWFVPQGWRSRVADALAWRLAALAQVPDEAAAWYPWPSVVVCNSTASWGSTWFTPPGGRGPRFLWRLLLAARPAAPTRWTTATPGNPAVRMNGNFIRTHNAG